MKQFIHWTNRCMVVLLLVVSCESFDVTFDKAGDYKFQCDPHAGAGMIGVIHVE